MLTLLLLLLVALIIKFILLPVIRILFFPANNTNKFFTNWANTFFQEPTVCYQPETVNQLSQILKEVENQNRQIKVIGNHLSCNSLTELRPSHRIGGSELEENETSGGNKWSKLFSTTHCVQLTIMNKVIAINRETMTVTVQPGITIRALHEELTKFYSTENKMTLPVVPLCGDITIGGAISTGTHGSAVNQGSLSSHVVSLEVLTMDGKLNKYTKADGDVFRAMACGLGCLGIITAVELPIVPIVAMQYVETPMTFSDMLTRADEILATNQHIYFNWFPHTNQVIAVTARQTAFSQVSVGSQSIATAIKSKVTASITASLIDGLTTLGLMGSPKSNIFMIQRMKSVAAVKSAVTTKQSMTSAELYSRLLSTLSTSQGQSVTMEYYAPMSNWKSVVAELSKLIDTNKSITLTPIISIQFVKKDDLLLGNPVDSCAIAITCSTEVDWQTSFDVIFRHLMDDDNAKFNLRPHWASWHKMTKSQLEQGYQSSALSVFNQLRARLDSRGQLLNEHLSTLLN